MWNKHWNNFNFNDLYTFVHKLWQAIFTINIAFSTNTPKIQQMQKKKKNYSMLDIKYETLYDFKEKKN